MSLISWSVIIEKMNQIFAGNRSVFHAEVWITSVVGNTSELPVLTEQTKANLDPRQLANGDYRPVLAQAVIRTLESHHSLAE